VGTVKARIKLNRSMKANSGFIKSILALKNKTQVVVGLGVVWI